MLTSLAVPTADFGLHASLAALPRPIPRAASRHPCAALLRIRPRERSSRPTAASESPAPRAPDRFRDPKHEARSAAAFKASSECSLKSIGDMISFGGNMVSLLFAQLPLFVPASRCSQLSVLSASHPSLRNAQNSVADKRIDAGSVSTQAMADCAPSPIAGRNGWPPSCRPRRTTARASCSPAARTSPPRRS